MDGLFITLEGTEGGGKTTQIPLLAARLRSLGREVRLLREPGGTPIGEEIRHTLKHSEQNRAMTPEAELLLMNASRAQLVREVIRPALAAGEIVLCDRFYDSTIAYQAYGRQLDLKRVQSIIDFAVGETRPHLTLLLMVPTVVSEARRQVRQASLLTVPKTASARPGEVPLQVDTHGPRRKSRLPNPEIRRKPEGPKSEGSPKTEVRSSVLATAVHLGIRTFFAFWISHSEIPVPSRKDDDLGHAQAISQTARHSFWTMRPWLP